MDRNPFDALARLVWITTSRRTALGGNCCCTDAEQFCVDTGGPNCEFPT